MKHHNVTLADEYHHTLQEFFLNNNEFPTLNLDPTNSFLKNINS